MQTTDEMGRIVNQAIPGYSGLTKSASSIVGNLMGGLPSAGTTQRANAYFGASSGMPGSDFIRNRGFDLYGQQAEGYKQRGFDDFLKLLSGTIGTVTPNAGQQQQQGQFDANLRLQQQQANAGIGRSNVADNAKQDALNRPGLTDGYYEENSLGMSPLFGRGSGNRRGLS
jgi:hypothetical protein